MRVILFSTSDHKYLAIKHRDDDSDIRIPVYKEELDGVYRQTPIFFPSCLKFFYSVNIKFDKQMTPEEISKQFGEISYPMNGHGLNRICYSALNHKQREVYHYHKVSAILADYGFQCTWLIDDWRGADFVAVGVDGTARLIQLKSGGYEINKKFCEYKDLWMLFQQREDWYLIKHCDLVKKADETTNQLNGKAWKEDGRFVIPRANPLPSPLEEALRNYKIT